MHRLSADDSHPTQSPIRSAATGVLVHARARTGLRVEALVAEVNVRLAGHPHECSCRSHLCGVPVYLAFHDILTHTRRSEVWARIDDPAITAKFYLRLPAVSDPQASRRRASANRALNAEARDVLLLFTVSNYLDGREVSRGRFLTF